VLVHHGAGQVEGFPVQHFAGIAHGQGERDAFVHGHVVEIDGHRQRGDLAFADAVVGDAFDEELDFFFAQHTAVAFFTDDFLGEEHFFISFFLLPNR
jgi:hypothetical protein